MKDGTSIATLQACAAATAIDSLRGIVGLTLALGTCSTKHFAGGGGGWGRSDRGC